MKRSHKVLGLALLVALAAGAVLAQRSRSVADQTNPTAAASPSPTLAPAPQTVRAKYEGGVFGYNRKLDGTLTFDDTNRRLLFRDKQNREVLFIPYDAVLGAFADTQSRRPAAATVIGSIPTIYTLPALLIRKKVRYLTIQYRDPDTDVAGVTSFKLDNKEILERVLVALAEKAGLVRRGEIFVRRRDDSSTSVREFPVATPSPSPQPTSPE
jgi:hypothetical protein